MRAIRSTDLTRIDNTSTSLAHEPRPHNAEKLAGSDGRMRIRLGDDRVIYDIYDGRLVVLVLAIGHRREGYCWYLGTEVLIELNAL